MKNLRILILMLLATVAVAAATSCSKNYEDKLIGSWSASMDSNTITFTFAKGGGGSITTSAGGLSLKGTIKWTLEGTTLTVILQIIEEKTTWHGTFDGKTLIIEGGTFTKK